MQKCFLLISTIIISFLGCKESNSSQLEKEVLVLSECEHGKIEAINDIKEDDLGLYFYGLPNPEFNTWVRLISKEYNLSKKGGGDVVDQKGECYNIIMREHIKQIYGKNAFKRIQYKLDSLYDMGKGDRDASFQGGEAELMKYLYCNINEDYFSDTSEDSPILVVQFIISREGVVQNIKIVFSNDRAKSNKKYSNIVFELIEKMPNRTPSRVNNQNGEILYTIPIKFYKEKKIEYCS